MTASSNAWRGEIGESVTPESRYTDYFGHIPELVAMD